MKLATHSGRFFHVTDACRYLMILSSTQMAAPVSAGGASAAARPVRAPEPITAIKAIHKYKQPVRPHKGPVGGSAVIRASPVKFPAAGRDLSSPGHFTGLVITRPAWADPGAWQAFRARSF
jgi:hypothetical protein